MVLRGACAKLYQMWEDIRSSSTLTRFVLDFRYLAPIQNVSGLKASRVENFTFIAPL